MNVLYWPSLMWSISPSGRQQARDLQVMLSFTKDVIDQRWAQFQALKSEYGSDFENLMFGDKNVRRNRIAFLGCMNYHAYEI